LLFKRSGAYAGKLQSLMPGQAAKGWYKPDAVISFNDTNGGNIDLQ
jgi:hypothetical protein